MKKLIALCLVLILAAPALTTNAESSLQKELNKELVKQLKKNYKKKKTLIPQHYSLTLFISA